VRLLLDEHLSSKIADALRRRGHELVAVGERLDWIQLSDEQVLAAARQERRAIVTSNVRDFRPLAAQAVLEGKSHFGLVLMPPGYRRRRKDVGRIVRALEAVLEAHPTADGLQDQEVWLSGRP